MNKFETLAAIIIIALCSLIIGVAIQETQQSTNISLNDGAVIVKRVCDHARSEDNGESEQLCGDMQETFGAEYLCSSYAADAKCWVEVK